MLRPTNLDSSRTPIVMSQAAFTLGETQGISPEKGANLILAGPLESLGWMVGFWTLHIALSVFLGASLFIVREILGELARNGQAIPFGDEIADSLFSVLLIGEMVGVTLLTMLMVWLRYGRVTLSVLEFRPMSLLHVLAIGLLVFPVGIVAQVVYQLASSAWQMVVEKFPLLEFVDAVNSVEQASMLVDQVPFAVLILCIAVCPAICEELVFRGVIGKGLVSHWGWLAGVVVSACMFAAMHLHPAHVIAVLPVGICIQLIYLWSRNFWLPMLLHFANNFWACTGEALEGAVGGSLVDLDSSYIVGLVGSSLVAIVGLMFFLYASRYRLDDSPDVTLEQATTGPEAARVRWTSRPDLAAFVVAGSTLVVFAGFVAATASEIEGAGAQLPPVGAEQQMAEPEE